MEESSKEEKGATRGLSKSQLEAIKFFEKMHREEIVSLQPERFYEDPDKEEDRRRKEPPNIVPKKLKP